MSELANMLGARVASATDPLTHEQALHIGASVREGRMTAAEAVTATPAIAPTGGVIDLGLSDREVLLSRLIHVESQSVEEAYKTAFHADPAEHAEAIAAEKDRLTKREQTRLDAEYAASPEGIAEQVTRAKQEQAAVEALHGDAKIALGLQGYPADVIERLSAQEAIEASGLVAHDESNDDTIENNLLAIQRGEGGEGQ